MRENDKKNYYYYFSFLYPLFYLITYQTKWTLKSFKSLKTTRWLVQDLLMVFKYMLNSTRSLN